MWLQLQSKLVQGDRKALARCISLIENEADGYKTFLQNLSPAIHPNVIGITGPPGAGKSTLTDKLIGKLAELEKKVGVICVDPSSPFNRGALLGDRIRMSRWYNHPGVFIRSLATRGSLGGLHPKIIEITDIMKAAALDYIIIETVGVGQSEVEIAGLADTTLLVLVPESGDDIQMMKAGIMEIADVFVINKADRPGADVFERNLRQMVAVPWGALLPIEIIQTVASQGTGIDELVSYLLNNRPAATAEKHNKLLAEKAYQLIQQQKMKTISKEGLLEEIKIFRQQNPHFNLYRFVTNYC